MIDDFGRLKDSRGNTIDEYHAWRPPERETPAMLEQQRRFCERMDAEDAVQPKDMSGRPLHSRRD